MKIGFRENYMPGKCKSYRETDAKRNNVSCHVCRHIYITKHMYFFRCKQKTQSKGKYGNIQHSIAPAACQVAKRLIGYPPGKGPVKKINRSDYDMS